MADQPSDHEHGSRLRSSDLNAEPHTLVFTCIHVWEQGMPIIHICHSKYDPDPSQEDPLTDSWAFLCEREHADSPELPIVVCYSHIVERDPSVRMIPVIPVDHYAVRGSSSDSWVVKSHEDDEE